MKMKLATVAALLAVGFVTPASAGERDLKDALELFYIKKGNMGTVACDLKKDSGNTYVYCYPAGEDRAKATGGLYALVESPPGIMPLNGKSLTHTSKLTSMEAVNGSRIPIVAAPKEMWPKVSSIRKLFE